MMGGASEVLAAGVRELLNGWLESPLGEPLGVRVLTKTARAARPAAPSKTPTARDPHELVAAALGSGVIARASAETRGATSGLPPGDRCASRSQLSCSFSPSGATSP